MRANTPARQPGFDRAIVAAAIGAPSALRSMVDMFVLVFHLDEKR